MHGARTEVFAAAITIVLGKPLRGLLCATLITPVMRLPGNIKNQTGWSILDQTIFLDYVILFGALAIVNWSGVARLIRGQVPSLREQDFIRAQVALGVPNSLVIRKHLVQCRHDLPCRPDQTSTAPPTRTRDRNGSHQLQ